MGGGMGGGVGSGMGGSRSKGAGRSSGSNIDPASAADPLANAVHYSPRAFRHHQPPQIALQPWDSATPYLTDLRAAAGGQEFAVYMKNRTRYANLPDFFLDCADFFFDRQKTDLAIQVLSNLAELAANDPALLRIMGHRLARAAAYDLAVETFEQVLSLEPNEPQSYRDLALALVERADAARSGMKPRTTPHVESGEAGRR